ncbi:MAG: hypothetical protein QM488_15935 [Rhizobiaceae bacterium]
MPRLTQQEIDLHRNWLEQWQEPASMLAYSDNVMDKMCSDHLFNQSGVGFLMEAFAAAEFAIYRSANHVQLMSEDRPDFELRVNNKVEKWELTEGDIPGRKRGLEYRIPKSEKFQFEDDRVEDWHVRADQVPEILRACATKKAGKNYPQGTRLLIYLNISVYGINQKEIEDCMAEATSPAKVAFQEVWVLWNREGYRLWVEGELAV